MDPVDSISLGRFGAGRESGSACQILLSQPGLVSKAYARWEHRVWREKWALEGNVETESFSQIKKEHQHLLGVWGRGCRAGRDAPDCTPTSETVATWRPTDVDLTPNLVQRQQESFRSEGSAGAGKGGLCRRLSLPHLELQRRDSISRKSCSGRVP